MQRLHQREMHCRMIMPKIRRPHARQKIQHLFWCINQEFRDDFNAAHRPDQGHHQDEIDHPSRDAFSWREALPFAHQGIHLSSDRMRAETSSAMKIRAMM